MNLPYRKSPEPFPGTPEALKAEEDRRHYWSDQAAKFEYLAAQREDALRAARRSLTIYRWLALIGWALTITALSVPRAQADTLPAGSLACDNALAYAAQMLTFSDATLIADPGCVFTDRDLVAHVVRGNEVFVEEIGFSVWADVEVLR